MTYERFAQKIKAEYAALRAETAAKRQRGERVKVTNRQAYLARIVKRLANPRLGAP
jgi:hypothetical protein